MLKIYAAYSEKKSDAYRLLALAVEETCGLPCPETAKDAYGKPYFPARPDIHFSISHTSGLVMAAVSGEECGCDAERVRSVPERVVQRVCAPEELAEFTFMELWTLKESIYKLLGHTSRPFRDLTFRRESGLPVPPFPGLHARLYTLPGIQLATVSKSPPPPAIKLLHF